MPSGGEQHVTFVGTIKIVHFSAFEQVGTPQRGGSTELYTSEVL